MGTLNALAARAKPKLGSGARFKVVEQSARGARDPAAVAAAIAS